MKKILCMFLCLMLLTGCSSSDPVKKPAPIDEDDATSEIPKEESMQAKEAAKGAEVSMVDGKKVLKNPDSTLVLVNKENALPDNWAPTDLVAPKVAFSFKEDHPRRYLRKEAAEALEALFSKAKEESIILYGVSGYRPFDTQKRIYNNEVNQVGEEEAKKNVAIPGYSEHQTGLCIDVSSEDMDFLLKEEFEDTKEGKWLADNAKDFGFIIRYPKDKVSITGYNYEPWHIRYVGVEAANFIVSHNITFDEYYTEVAKK